ncbi:MAG: HEAT repeat domain-containing protein [Acidobacteria bacterium]|nr:HEAT repeat domain-containing protein [Acidobacteriota bacterium]
MQKIVGHTLYHRLPGLIIAGTLLISSTITSFGQSEEERKADQQTPLAIRLASSQEEERLDSLVQLGTLFSKSSTRPTQTTIAALANTLREDPSPVIRALSARTLELANDPRAVAPLLDSLKKEREIAVCKAIIYALARYPSPQVSYQLRPYIEHKKQEVRAAAVYTLAELCDPLAAQPLMDFIRKHRGESDAFARSQAVRGLGGIGNRQSIEILLKALTHDKSSEVRREAAQALGKIANRDDTQVIEALRKAALTSDPYLTMAVDQALALINSRNE